MLVEKDDSAYLRTQVTEMKESSKNRIRREKERARTLVEQVEERARERDEQWKKYFSESSLKARTEAEKRLEERDLVWENRLESQLREQVEQHERSRAQMERTMIEGTVSEIKRLEEQMAKAQVGQVLQYQNRSLLAVLQVENERTIAKMLQKETTQRRQFNASQQGVSTMPQPSTSLLGFSTATPVPSDPSFGWPSATTSLRSSSTVIPVTQTTLEGFGPVASCTTNIFDQIASVRRAHTRTNIKTKLVLNEVE